MWTSFGYPYPLAERQGERPRVWHYPGGYVEDVGNYPRDDPDALGWDLFFSFNPDLERNVHCTATFVYEADPPRPSSSTSIPAGRSCTGSTMRSTVS